MKNLNKTAKFEPLEFVSENEAPKDGKTRPNFPVWTIIENQRWEITSVEKGIVNLESSRTKRLKQIKLIGSTFKAHFRDKTHLADFILTIKKDKNYYEFE